MRSISHKYSLDPVDVPRVETRYRRIITKLPVPESIGIFAKLDILEPSSMRSQPPIVIHRSEGFNVFDRWGNKWLDWSSGVLISNVGNSHPKIVKSIRDLLDRPLLSTYVFAHEQRAELLALLASIAPDTNYKVFLLSTGSEAVENCIKLAKTYGIEKYGPEKRIFISFKNAFHGRTMGAQLAGGMDSQKKWLGDLDDSFVQVPFPDGHMCQDNSFGVFLTTLEKKGIKGYQVCAVMSESYQSVGPYFFPKDYAQRLEQWCREHDALLIMDEIQAGFGRTGKWFTFEHYGIKPDLIACGKGITSSLPLSAVIGRSDVMELYPPGAMTSTHSGSPVPVAAAIASINLLKEGPYMKNVQDLDPLMRDNLISIQKLHPKHVACVRSLGLVAGMQILNPETALPDGETALKLNEKCFHKGLLMYAPVGEYSNCVKIAPPLSITRDALEEGMGVLRQAMDEVLT